MRSSQRAKTLRINSSNSFGVRDLLLRLLREAMRVRWLVGVLLDMGVMLVGRRIGMG